MKENSSELIGSVVGERFTTSSLQSYRGADPTWKPVRVIWRNADAWRLRLLNRGNDPWQLPGADQLITRDTVRATAESGRAMIVVGGRSSGLTSLFHWLAAEAKTLRCLAVELTEAQLRGRDSDQRVEAIALGLKRAVRAHLKRAQESDAASEQGIGEAIQEANDPIDILREIAGHRDQLGIDALIFRSFEALDDETALRIFGRLRALFEEPGRPLGSLGIVLLGQSIDALDPEHQRPVSTLLSTSDLYIPTVLTGEEVEEMLTIAGKTGDLQRVLDWTGGDPFLVQTLLSLLAPPPIGEGRCASLEEAIRVLRYNRPPSMQTWLHSLQIRFNSQPVRRIIDRLLRNRLYRDEPFEPRMPILSLYVDGWIYLDPAKGLWTWRSELRRLLATEAYGERERP